MNLAEYRKGNCTEIEGAIPNAIFNVSKEKNVVFSKGNLQFRRMGSHKTMEGTAKGIWRFAESQYDFIGDGNYSISEDYSGWIDLFSWGTSGWNSGAEVSQPWDIDDVDSYSEYYVDYYSDGKVVNLVGKYAYSDWGVYNAISNGGNQPGLWRTLSIDEWRYLLQNNRWALVSVEGILGVMLLPADFIAPKGITVSEVGVGKMTEYKLDFATIENQYSFEQFAQLEECGVVLLPACGSRIRFQTNMIILGVGELGHYWSTSAENTKRVKNLSFDSDGIDLRDSGGYQFGQSVRLVQDIK